MDRNDIPQHLQLAFWHLDNWARWMRYANGVVSKGYPRAAAGLSTGGGSTHEAFDCMCEAEDEKAAAVSDAIIDSLSPRESAVIHHVHLQSVFRFRDPIENIYPDAVEKFWRAGQARGLA